MKPNREERENLARLIRNRRANLSFSNAEIAAIAGVDPGQTSRILEGQFRTISGNVLRICNALGIDPLGADVGSLTLKDVGKRAAWARLEASVRRAWDQTPQGADRLVTVIDAVANLKPTGRRKKSDPDAPHVDTPTA